MPEFFFPKLLNLDIAQLDNFSIFILITNQKGFKTLKSKVEKQLFDCMVAKTDYTDEILAKSK